uniref:Uncharacterized protein n=1 Tax=Oryza punctata TaxID=4537 RepID=A0A0E0MCP4_ORYPU
MSPDADAAAAAAGEGAAAAAAAAGTAGEGRGVIRWDQILPRRSLRVLLVEHDDSTRQVVTALLRKCGYRVAALADGMKAWGVMRERAYAFDLVLTEVTMPTLSGIELLSRIVASDECKNIPVIMMSSQDSIGTVLRCMQKGAVDFLVKPVRKNELRNLWQHVWRRHAMNSQTNASENNAASNHLSANGDNGSKTGENSDEESDAQSSGSKREVEIQSAEKLPEVVEDGGAGSSREHKIQNGFVDGLNTKSHALKANDDAPSGNACGDSELQVLSTEKNVRSQFLNGITSAKVAGQIMDNALRFADSSSLHSSDPGKDLLVVAQTTADRKCKSSALENNAVIENKLSENSKGTATGHAESCPSHFLEINLEQQHNINGYTNHKFKEKDIFNHSNSSAFSRYGNKKIESSAQRPFPPSFRVVHQQPVYDKNPQSSRVLLSCEHTTRESIVQAQVPLNRSTEGAAILCSSSVREDAGTSSSSPRKDAAINKTAIQHASCQSNYHENLGKPPQIDEHKQPEENHQLNHSRQILRESGEPVDLAKAHMERINQSASCSQDIRKGSGCTGSGETDANTNTVIALESGNESGVQNCSNNVLDGDRSRREAALLKFRMKRKDRCFEKKVRYHSRKKLAEQRPRVKGQFVSQKLRSAITTEAETD